MHPGKLNVLQHAANQGRLAIGDTIHIELNGVFEELIDEHRLIRHNFKRLADDGFKFFFAVNDKHAAPTEDKRGPQ